MRTEVLAVSPATEALTWIVAITVLADSSVLFEVGQSNPRGAERTGHGMYFSLTVAFCLRTRSRDWMRESVEEQRGRMSADSSMCTVVPVRACAT